MHCWKSHIKSHTEQKAKSETGEEDLWLLFTNPGSSSKFSFIYSIPILDLRRCELVILPVLFPLEVFVQIRPTLNCGDLIQLKFQCTDGNWYAKKLFFK